MPGKDPCTWFFGKISEALSQQNGQRIKGLLRYEEPFAGLKTKIIETAAIWSQFQQTCEETFPGNYAIIFAHHIRCQYLYSQSQYRDACEAQLIACDAFSSQMNHDKDTNWWLPLNQIIVLQLRMTAYKADESAKSSNTGIDAKQQYAMRVVESFRKIFRQMVQSRMDPVNTKAYGSLFMILQMIKIYFKINNIQLCGKTINLFKGAFPDISLFPKSQTAAFHYYHGRFLISSGSYAEAADALENAFLQCHKDSKKNQTLILEYLICVKMYLGVLPSGEMMRAFPLDHLEDIITSVKTGNLKLYNLAMEKNLSYFIRKGVYLIVEQLKKLAVNGRLPDTSKAHQVSISTLVAGIRISGEEDISKDEVECILSNLIFEGFAKGYIAHGNAVVFSLKLAFPKLSDVAFSKPSSLDTSYSNNGSSTELFFKASMMVKPDWRERIGASSFQTLSLVNSVAALFGTSRGDAVPFSDTRSKKLMKSMFGRELLSSTGLEVSSRNRPVKLNADCPMFISGGLEDGIAGRGVGRGGGSWKQVGAECATP